MRALELILFINISLFYRKHFCDIEYVIVEKCPLNEREWEARARLVHCKSTFFYSCLPSTTGDFVELCQRGYILSENVCPEFDPEDTFSKLRKTNCSKKFGCPKESYHLREMYKYPACLIRNQTRNITPEPVSSSILSTTVKNLSNNNIGNTKFQQEYQEYVLSTSRSAHNTRPNFGFNLFQVLLNVTGAAFITPLSDFGTQVLIAAGGAIVLLFILFIVLLVYINKTKLTGSLGDKKEGSATVLSVTAHNLHLNPSGVHLNSIYDEVEHGVINIESQASHQGEASEMDNAASHSTSEEETGRRNNVETQNSQGESTERVNE